MPDGVLVVRHVDAAQPQRSAVGQAMGVVANANACGMRSDVPVCSDPRRCDGFAKCAKAFVGRIIAEMQNRGNGDNGPRPRAESAVAPAGRGGRHFHGEVHGRLEQFVARLLGRTPLITVERIDRI
jgi:hypothetical protein